MSQGQCKTNAIFWGSWLVQDAGLNIGCSQELDETEEKHLPGGHNYTAYIAASYIKYILYVQEVVTLQKKIFYYICIRKLGLHRFFLTITIIRLQSKIILCHMN